MNVDWVTVAVGLLALQLAAFAWRINREVSMEGQGERTWLPLSDWINMAALVATAGFGLVIPLYSGAFDRLSRSVLVAAVFLIATYPICQAAHYRLFSPHGRRAYERGAPWITGQEVVATLFSVSLAAIASCAVWHAN